MSLGLSIPAHIWQNQIKHHRFKMQVLQREHFSSFFPPISNMTFTGISTS